jgi:GrpB-like predicted nucleotidyltransferase (UPF0157 family)
LRAHPNKARAYGNLKKSLASSFEDEITGHHTVKHDFIVAARAKARAQRRSAT